MSPAAAERPRTLCPPERRVAEVTEVRRLGAYDLICARDPVGPRDPRPGQFYMLAAGERWGGGSGERPYLPRAFSFARARPGAGGGADLEFLLEDVGPGTRRLGELGAGDPLMLLGPLGAGFGPPAAGTRPLLVGGGIGTAPILALHDEHPEAPIVLGFRSASHAEAAQLFGGSPLLTTDDGSAGQPGPRDRAPAPPAGRRPRGNRVRLRPTADAGGGEGTLHRARHPRRTCTGSGNGVRLRRLLRLRGADKGRLRPRLRGRPRIRRSDARALGPDD